MKRIVSGQNKKHVKRKETNMKVTINNNIGAQHISVKKLVKLMDTDILQTGEGLRVMYDELPDKAESKTFWDGALFMLAEHTIDGENIFVAFDTECTLCTMTAREMLDSFKGCGKCFTVIPTYHPIRIDC